MASIEVERQGEGHFRVTIRDSASSSHEVRVSGEEAQRFGGGAEPERLVEESFRFLLEREPASSILPRFALSTIADYFPEYPEEIRRRLG